jgi:hypothetical protein
LEHVIVRAGREGYRVHVGNTVAVIVVDIGYENIPLGLVLTGIRLARQRIGTSSGCDRSCDAKDYETVPDGEGIPFSQRAPSSVISIGISFSAEPVGDAFSHRLSHLAAVRKHKSGLGTCQ